MTRLLFFIFILSSFISKSADPVDLFEEESILNISIITEPDKLFSDRNESSYHNARIIIKSSDWIVAGQSKVRLAGNSRKAICDLPPLKVDLEEIKQPWPHKIKKLKIVSTCILSDEYEQILYKEYLSYKVYNAISPISLRVRLANILVLDKDGKEYARYMGFLLEPDHHLEDRLQLKEIKSEEAPAGDLIELFYKQRTASTLHTANFIAFFQFMIANTDWAVHTRQNVKVFERNDSLYLVPYDFDYSGLVDAPYSIPASNLPIESVEQRFYQGLVYDYDDLEEVRDHYNLIEQEVYAVLDKAPLTNENHRECKKLIERFYRIVNNRDRFEKFLEQSQDHLSEVSQ